MLKSLAPQKYRRDLWQLFDRLGTLNEICFNLYLRGWPKAASGAVRESLEQLEQQAEDTGIASQIAILSKAIELGDLELVRSVDVEKLLQKDTTHIFEDKIRTEAIMDILRPPIQ